MTAIGAALSRALGSLGGPPMATAIVAGGLVAGVVGGGLVAGGGSGQGATAEGSLPVYACPARGAPVAMVQAGQRLLVTGRTEDAGWLRIHFPEPGRTEAWVQAGPLQVKGAVAELPVAECAPEVAGVLPSFEPGPSLTAIVNLPDPTMTAPSAGPSATPTAAPDERPAITALTVSTARISHDTGSYCPRATGKATFTVKASDDVGLARVSLFWRAPGASAYVQAAMTRVSGSPTKGTWQVSLSAGSGGITRAGRLAYYAVATDTAGATRRLPQGETDSITVEVCENEGPEITKVASLSGNRLAWDPLGAGRCQTATDITAVIRDVDGVRSASLFYRRPGETGWQSKRMDDGTLRGRWYANLDTLGDRITIPNPPTGTLRWYIRAVDDTGKSRQTSTREMTIRRCDTPADIGDSSYQLICSRSPSWIYGNAADPDGIGPRSAVLVYTYYLNDGTRRTGRKRMDGSNDGRWYYSVQIEPGANWNLNRSPFTFFIETTDAYGGTSRGGHGETDVTSC